MALSRVCSLLKKLHPSSEGFGNRCRCWPRCLLPGRVLTKLMSTLACFFCSSNLTRSHEFSNLTLPSSRVHTQTLRLKNPEAPSCISSLGLHIWEYKQRIAMTRPKRAAAAAAPLPPKRSRKNQKETDKKDEETPKRSRRNSKTEPEEPKVEEEAPGPRVAKSSRSTSENSESPLLVFAHGAGANSSHEFMVRWKKLLGEATNAVEVVTFDYPYCANGKKGAPPKAEKLVGSHVEEIRKATSRHVGHPLVLVGKSMGSRVSCMVAGLEDTEVAAVVCLGYPLKGTNGALRDQTLVELQAPVLFVQGSKDSMCPLTELEKVRKKLTVMNEVHVVEGGDHSIKISKRASGMSQDESDHFALDRISAFIVKALTNTK